MRTVFIGSSDFGLPALRGLTESAPPLLVVSQPDKAAGRNLRTQSCPVADYAKRKGLDLYQPQDINAAESLEKIIALGPKLLITASYGSLLKRELRRIPKYGALNLHPSLLPKYRGATPIQSALLQGEEVTGVTIFKLNARMDAGPIFAQEEIPIAPDDNYSSLHDKLAALAADMLMDLLPRIFSGSAVTHEQDEIQATHTCKLRKEDLLLDWGRPASEVLSRIRAFSFVPGAYSFWQDAPLKILRAEATENPSQNVPGSVGRIINNIGFTVNCRDRQLLVTAVQPAGKKVMAASAFQAGARFSSGALFSDGNSHTSTNPTLLREEP
jgi:methionyl-tRNA formyltransferase